MTSLSPPLSRNTDPHSSHSGADHIVNSGKLNKQLQQVYKGLTLHPMHTARELSRATGIDYYIIQRRLSELERRNMARRAGERVCNASTTNIKVQIWDVM